MSLFIRTLSITTLASLAVSMEPIAFGGIDFEVFGGQKSSTFSYTDPTGSTTSSLKSTVKGTDMGAALHYQFSNTFPMSLGITADSYSFKVNDMASLINQGGLGNDLPLYNTTATGTTSALLYGPEVVMWLPFPWIQPFLRVNGKTGTETSKYTFVDTMIDGTSHNWNNSEKDTYQIKTTGVSLGFRFSPVPLIGLFAEYAMESGSRTHKTTSLDEKITTSSGTTSYTNNTINTNEQKTQPYSSKTIRLGLRLAI